jgi:hypothetical protein
MHRGKSLPYPFDREAGWAPELAWIELNKYKLDNKNGERHVLGGNCSHEIVKNFRGFLIPLLLADYYLPLTSQQ